MTAPNTTPPGEASTTEDQAGWIPWHGGECPVPPKTIVECRLRDGGVIGPASSWGLRWLHESGSGDITAYRIVSPVPDAIAEAVAKAVEAKREALCAIVKEICEGFEDYTAPVIAEQIDNAIRARGQGG